LVEGVLGGRQASAGGDTAREATSDEVKALRAEARQLKEALAEATLENRLLKKSVIRDGEDAT
jgi:transposase